MFKFKQRQQDQLALPGVMDQHQHQREEQKEQDQDHLLLHKEEEEQLLGPDVFVVHTTNLPLGEKTSSVQLQGSPGTGNAACSVLSSSVGPSEALPIVVGLAWTLQNGGDAAPMQSPGVDSLSAHKRGRGRPRKDQQSQQANLPPPTPPASRRRGIKVGCGRPMLAPTSSHLETHRGPPAGSWRPIIIEKKLPAAWWSVDAASTGIKRPRGRPRMYRPDAASTGDAAASPGIKGGRGRPRKERPDAASSGIKRGRGRPRKEKPESRMCAQTGHAFASRGIKRGGGHPELEMEMLAAAAATAMLSETGDDDVPTGTKGVVVDVVSTGMDGALEKPTPRTEKPSEGDIMSMVMKRGPGRPRKDQQPQAPATPTALSTGGGIKRGRGRPRKDQQSQAAKSPPPTPTALSRRGIKVGCGRPMIIGKPAAASWSVDAVSTGMKRPCGRPRKETRSVAMSVETGDAMPARETGDAMPAPETGDATPAPETGDAMSAPETGDATPAPETGDATPAPETGRATATATKRRRGRGRPRKEGPDGASSGMKRERGRPRKEKAEEARMSMGFKRREAGMDMLAAAAMLAESGWR